MLLVQTAQLMPPWPHDVVVSPGSHWPDALQQPWQLAGVHWVVCIASQVPELQTMVVGQATQS